MKLTDGVDLLSWTYFMVDWKEVAQTPTSTRCVQCGGQMSETGPVKDARGGTYSGVVCHACRRVLWVRER